MIGCLTETTTCVVVRINLGKLLSPALISLKIKGPNWDLNPGPPAPKAGIIPLDHLALYTQIKDVRSISFEHTVDA